MTGLAVLGRDLSCVGGGAEPSPYPRPIGTDMEVVARLNVCILPGSVGMNPPTVWREKAQLM